MNQKLIFKKFSLWNSVSLLLGWILQTFTFEGLAPRRDFEYLINHLKSLSDSRGPEYSFAYAKKIRGAIMNYLSGNPERFDKVRYTKDGIPTCLGPLVKEFRRGPSPASLQIVNSILFSPRALNLGKDPDFTPITSPQIGGISNIGMWAGSFWRDLGYTPSPGIPSSLQWKYFHFSTKSGPLGHALGSSMEELFILPKSLIQSLEIMGGEKFTEHIRNLLGATDLRDWFRNYWGKFLSKIHSSSETGTFRKITYFPDKEMKVRVIAQLDYWSQTVLKPLHHYLFRVLKKIPQDCTFDQGSFKEKLVNSTVFYSIDLTAATDRFPIELIGQILNAQLPQSYVTAWKDVMVGYSFDVKTKGGTQKISYAVGNPMGAYSSWASFAVTHHYLIYYCCRILGKDWKVLPYVLLGDDIVIGDKDVAEEYLKVLNTLGVGVSSAKTHSSPHFYEFAKRLIYKGVEISPFPVSALRETLKDNSLFVNLLVELEPKGWVTHSGIPKALAEFSGRFKNYPSRLKKRVGLQAFITERMIKIVRDTSRAELLNEVFRELGYQLPTLSLEVCQNILSNIIVECFSDSFNNLSSIKRGVGLGQLALDMVIYLTGHENPQALEWLGNPVLRSYGRIEETYVNLTKEALRLDQQGELWTSMMKTIALPLDDTIFVKRTSHLKVKASSIIGKKLCQRAEVLLAYPSLLQ